MTGSLYSRPRVAMKKNGGTPQHEERKKPATSRTEAELLRLSEQEGHPDLGELTEREARRRIAELKRQRDS